MSRWPWFSRRRRDQDLDDEIETHLAMAMRDHIEQGDEPQSAAFAARREFGNRTLVKETTREIWGWHAFETLWQDLRYALRMMRRSGGFTFVAVLSLALGIGANTAIFSVINTLMLRLLPVRNPEQLVELLQKYPGEPRGNGFWSWESYKHFRDHNHVFSDLISFVDSHFSVRGEHAEPETVNGEYVTGNFFSALGVKPAIGRLIVPEDDRMGAPSSVAVVTWSFWKRRFNLDPGVVGKQIILDNVPVTIAGVTQSDFSGLEVWSKPDIWLPVAMEPVVSHTTADRMRLGLLGRLKPGVSLDQARAEMSVLYRFTIAERARTSNDPVVQQLRVEVEPAGAGLSRLRDQLAKPMLLLMSVAGVLLLIACTNIATLLLARGAARQSEMAMRVSLGAGRFRLVRQVLTESLLLSAAGSLLGIWLAYFGAGALVRLMLAGLRDPGLPQGIEIRVQPDAHVLLFTTGVAAFTGILFGLAPAWNAFTSAPAPMLREFGKAGETKFRRLFGKSLVATQVTFSVVLLTAAALFISRLSNLEHLDLGFQREHVLLVRLDATHGGLRPEQLIRPYQELLSQLERIPGVRSATLCASAPISGSGASRFVMVEGHAERPEDRRYTSLNWIAPNYFATLGTPLLAGRDFSFADEGRSLVAIINQAMAHHYFGDGNPLGTRLTFDGSGQSYVIVGVVGNAKYYDIREASLRTIYLNAFQDWHAPSQFVLRTNGKPTAVAGAVRRTIGALLSTAPGIRVTTLSDQVDASIVPERLIAALSGLFGAFGSLLAAIGLYGLLAYTVARRVNEIGIRIALGATQADVLRMVFKDALGMVCAGLVLGIPLALFGKRFAASLIEGLPLQSAMPIVFGVVAMIAIALLAAYVPARRAAHVDPVEALRYE